MYAASKRQRTARRALVRRFRSAASTRSALRYNRVMSTSARFRGRGELKSVDGQAAVATNSVVNLNTSSGNGFPLNAIAVGPTFFERVGRRIEMASLHLKGVITQTGNVTTVMDYCRLAIVYDRQPNGAFPTTTTIFQDYSPTGVTGSSPSSGVNPDERERFLVLSDIKLALPPTTAAQFSGTDGVTTSFNINRFINLKGLKTHYKDDSSNISGIATGSLLIIGMGQLASGSEGWHFVGTWRLRYADT